MTGTSDQLPPGRTNQSPKEPDPAQIRAGLETLAQACGFRSLAHLRAAVARMYPPETPKMPAERLSMADTPSESDPALDWLRRAARESQR